MKNIILFFLGLMVSTSIFFVGIQATSTPTSSQPQPTETPTPPPDEW